MLDNKAQMGIHILSTLDIPTSPQIDIAIVKKKYELTTLGFFKFIRILLAKIRIMVFDIYLHIHLILTE